MRRHIRDDRAPTAAERSADSRGDERLPEGSITPSMGGSLTPRIPAGGDRRVVVNARGEQSLLRKHLFGDDLLATCALCGRDLPVAMLVTAHIKRRADTSRAERGRTDTVMPACLIGCDSLFELGYVTTAWVDHPRGPKRPEDRVAPSRAERALSEQSSAARRGRCSRGAMRRRIERDSRRGL